ncbi:MAG: PfkB family carbohydrate kinase, partial [Bacteroidota bacterium]
MINFKIVHVQVSDKTFCSMLLDTCKSNIDQLVVAFFQGSLLLEAMTSAGVGAVYQVRKKERTGICAALINREKRCLVTELNAAVNFDADIHNDAAIDGALSEACLIYVGGYMWTSSPSTVVAVANYANENNVPLAMNLHASYLCSFFASPEYDILPQIDYLFGNAREALCFAQCLAASKLPYASLFSRFLEETEPSPQIVLDIAKEVAMLPKITGSGRQVIFTNGRNPVAFCDSTAEVRGLTPVLPLPVDQVKDTNGCGD